MVYLESARREHWDRSGTVLLRNAVTSVAVRHVIVAEAATKRPAFLEVCRTALACVTAYAVFSTAWLQDGLPGEGFPILDINKQPEKDNRPQYVYFK